MLHNTFLRIIFLFCLILSSMALFAACSKGSSPGGENNNKSNLPDDSAEDGTKAPDVNYVEELPEMDFGGETFTFLSYGDGTDKSWHAMDVVAEEDSGDPLDDAITARNRNVEERFGVKIAVNFNGSPSSVAKSVKSGGNDFDAVWLDMNGSGVSAQSGYFLNLRELTYINLDKLYWDQSVTRDLSVANKVYFATGDVSIVDKRATWILMFNKALLSRFAFESPYALVNSGDWTMDKFTEIAKNASKNLNGTGIWDENDQYGFSTTNDTIPGLFYSCGEKVVVKNSEDMLEFAYNDSANLNKLHDIIQKSVEIMKNNNITLCSADIKAAEPWKLTKAAFEDNRALFYGEVAAYVVNLRAMETDFGIIPMPKYNKEQQHYISYVNPAACFLGVPVTCADTAFVSVIIEAMAAESSRILKPAYYDVLLKEKGARDEESVEMLDLIFQHRVYDLGLIYNYGEVVSSYTGLVAKGDANVASMIDKQSAKAEKQINDFNNKILDLD